MTSNNGGTAANGLFAAWPAHLMVLLVVAAALYSFAHRPLPAFAPTAVLSARRTRCEETVAPLAERLGLPVEPLDALGEEEFAADPQAGLAVVEQLLAPRPAPGVTVVCSQGGAIPAILLSLGVRWEGVAGRLYPPAAKGSVWVLGGRPGALSADYYRDVFADPEAPS